MNDAAQIRRCSGARRTNDWFFRPSPDGRRPNLKISNRESIRLETAVTVRKYGTEAESNRENNARFSNRVRADDSARRNNEAQPAIIKRPKRELHARKSARRSKTLTTHPWFLFRLKSIPTACFLKLTSHFNRTMFRLRRRQSEENAKAAQSSRAGTPTAGVAGAASPAPLRRERRRQRRKSKTPAGSLRYDGNNDGDGGAKRVGAICLRNLRRLGLFFGRLGGLGFRDRNSSFR
jgi:hypothetical protein